MFHVSLVKEDGVDALGAGAVVDGRYRALPGSFQKRKLLGGVDDALSAFVTHFRAFSGPFSGSPDESKEFDLGALVGEPDLRLVRQNLFIRLKGRDGAEVRFGSESVVVLEILLALGNELAMRSSNTELAAAWRRIAELCELLPMAAENWFEGPSEERILGEAEWYARRIGQDVGYYVAAAKWLRARQFLFAIGEAPSEPTPGEYDPSTRLDLPTSVKIDALVARAAVVAKQDIPFFIIDAISDRNISARQEVVFRRWYGSDREDSDPAT
jgi:hypothetical protein